ncbi:hypothetical protein [Burkholderia sp. LA-2-3-30-S1-D2]|uniref:hypothetical protein n=1 Tax=Burkholderia sp. LA-2-3-30-S1-D2 TaxID=1637862 RepID=UPI00131F3F06|nr:hypothetical protein [Burkholderia sp. LA-2-3-30-S1-D2]
MQAHRNTDANASRGRAGLLARSSRRTSRRPVLREISRYSTVNHFSVTEKSDEFDALSEIKT